jgi:predicted ArsR family transcriptional regulator
MPKGKTSQGNKTRDKILAVLKQDKYKHGTTIRIIAEELGLSSTSTVNFHIEKLREEGIVAKADYYGQARSIRLAD